VLSVVAQQILTIQRALAAKVSHPLFKFRNRCELSFGENINASA
jgi:hypothetical protein